VGDQAIQVFGGIGFTWEHDAHLYLKRLLSFSGFLGSPGSYQERIGREMMGIS
jgi:alkylation response protein AidB-like acyl-CoA dehydrogenase